MMWNTKYGTILALTLLVLSGCGKAVPTSSEGTEVKLEGGFYQDISAEEFDIMLQSKDFVLINVHIPYGGEIRGTDLFVPYNNVEENLLQFPEDKGAKIVVYCRSGSMSAIAARTLVGLGFTNIRNLDGGMVEWERQGYELIRKQE